MKLQILFWMLGVLRITEPQQNEPTNTKDDECCGLCGTLGISPQPEKLVLVADIHSLAPNLFAYHLEP